jgi:hypothetical protein
MKRGAGHCRTAYLVLAEQEQIEVSEEVASSAPKRLIRCSLIG